MADRTSKLFDEIFENELNEQNPGSYFHAKVDFSIGTDEVVSLIHAYMCRILILKRKT